MASITVTCKNCQKAYPIAHEKIDKTRQKLQFKCNNCGQMVLFINPLFVAPQPKEDFTEIPTGLDDKPKPVKPRLYEPATGKVYLLKPGKNVIGRRGDLLTEHPDSYISRLHCLIEVVVGNNMSRVVLTDDGSLNGGKASANGTFHNNIRLSVYDKIVLNDGEKIRIGHTDLIYQAY